MTGRQVAPAALDRRAAGILLERSSDRERTLTASLVTATSRSRQARSLLSSDAAINAAVCERSRPAIVRPPARDRASGLGRGQPRPPMRTLRVAVAQQRVLYRQDVEWIAERIRWHPSRTGAPPSRSRSREIQKPERHTPTIRSGRLSLTQKNPNQPAVLSGGVHALAHIPKEIECRRSVALPVLDSYSQ